MNEKQDLYFSALIPQQELCDEITGLKKDFAARFNSKRALRVMPHITLKAPFMLSHDEHGNLLEWFNKLTLTGKPFNIKLNGFGAFQNKRSPVVFIDPVVNTELFLLQKQIISSFKNPYPMHMHNVDAKFKPHITIAYRDLEPAKFEEAWQEYKTKAFHATFQVTAVYLLQHDTRQWSIISTCPL
jgi:2'-5' RNA ligase